MLTEVGMKQKGAGFRLYLVGSCAVAWAFGLGAASCSGRDFQAEPGAAGRGVESGSSGVGESGVGAVNGGAAASGGATDSPPAEGAHDPGSSGAAGTGNDAPDEPDTSPPTVVDVSPGDGAVGVAANAVLSVTFSEAMNKSITQNAYQSASAGITAAAVTFSWNQPGTVLTITPNAPLTYAAGTTPAAVTARAYDFVVSNMAEDAAGNALQTEIEVRFSTLRRITQKLTASAYPLTGGYVVNESSEAVTTYMDVGCLEANEVFRSLVSFELGALPTGIEEFESASLQLFQTSQSSFDRTPYEALGDLQLLSLVYAGANRAAFDAMDAADALVIGTFGTSAAMAYKSVVVTDTFAADYQSRTRSQYGVKFATKLNTDGHHDIVYFATEGDANPPILATTYLLP
jgi:hypothetical protein